MAEEDESSIELPDLKQVSSSMVAIREKSEWSVFPPINHENLQVSSRFPKEEEEEDEEQNTPSSFSPPSSDLLSSPSRSSITSSSSTSSFPPSENGDEVSHVEPERSNSTVQVREAGNVSCGWWRIGFGVLSSKAWGIAAWPFGCGNTARGRTFWSFVPTAAAILWLLYWRFQLWRWRIRRERAEKRLSRLVKEKDEKIAQLLNQIARMNELLISQHRA